MFLLFPPLQYFCPQVMTDIGRGNASVSFGLPAMAPKLDEPLHGWRTHQVRLAAPGSFGRIRKIALRLVRTALGVY